jgi:hypothetical protein
VTVITVTGMLPATPTALPAMEGGLQKGGYLISQRDRDRETDRQQKAFLLPVVWNDEIVNLYLYSETSIHRFSGDRKI